MPASSRPALLTAPPATGGLVAQALGGGQRFAVDDHLAARTWALVVVWEGRAPPTPLRQRRERASADGDGVADPGVVVADVILELAGCGADAADLATRVEVVRTLHGDVLRRLAAGEEE